MPSKYLIHLRHRGVELVKLWRWHWEVIMSWESVKISDCKDCVPELARARGEFTKKWKSGKNPEDIFKQLQSNSTNIYWAPSMGKKLGWLLWETPHGVPTGVQWGKRNMNESSAHWGSSWCVSQGPTKHHRWEITLGHGECKLPARRSISELSLGREGLWQVCHC